MRCKRRVAAMAERRSESSPRQLCHAASSAFRRRSEKPISSHSAMHGISAIDAIDTSRRHHARRMSRMAKPAAA